MTHATTDYRKWELLDAGSSDDEGPGPTEAAEVAQKLLTEWLVEANPGLTAVEAAHLVAFIEVQQRHVGQNDNLPRAKEIIDFYDSGSAPQVEPLLAVCWAARLKGLDDEDPGIQARNTRVKAALTSALNTAAACHELGGARRLFDTMWSEPQGQVARDYASLRYAQAALQKHARAWTSSYCTGAQPSSERAAKREGERAVAAAAAIEARRPPFLAAARPPEPAWAASWRGFKVVATALAVLLAVVVRLLSPPPSPSGAWKPEAPPGRSA